MLFNSVEFILLLALTLSCYWIIPNLKVRQWVIFFSSIYFYWSWSKAFLLMLLILILVNWVIGMCIAKQRNRVWLILACTINLGLLAYFKYADFFISNLTSLAQFIEPKFNLVHISVLLPLGISFYIFELISYLVDVYKGKIEHEQNPLIFALFVLFFPHLVAGPICRAGQFIPQVKKNQTFSPVNFYNGMYWFLAGFALKCGIADGLAPFVNVIFKQPNLYSGFDNLLATIGFGVQILCDFWGYSLMALGASLLFGFVLPINFNAPYSSCSIRDFWRRWHITLSNWLRDYLYIPLGGSRTLSDWKVQRNLIVTMLLGGFWHGASWNFIIWGGIHGFALAINRWFDNAKLPTGVISCFRYPPIAWCLTMIIVFVAWVFFRATDFSVAVAILSKISTFNKDWFSTKLEPVFFELLIIYLFLQWLVNHTTNNFNMAIQPVKIQAISIAILVAFSLIYYVDGNQFIYFQF